MTARQAIERRWHLKARREVEKCGCLWVVPYNDRRLGYRSWWCLGHRWTRENTLTTGRRGSR
jgi:hypothetical protein